MIKLLIVDDHKMFVEGLESILAREDDIKIIHKCYEGKDVFNMALLESIDVILLDINLPDMSGIEISKRILKMKEDLKILVLSMHDEESYITEVLKSGSLGYILKNTGRKELITAIRTVATGRTYFSQSITNTIMNSLMDSSKKPKTQEAQVPKITRREKEVLDLILEENTNQEIANLLFISLKTVEAHRSSLLSKLNARNTAGLVKKAIAFKLAM
ncbi:MAG: response regulator transcription factor [Saprospiraceae bacterium]